MRKEIRFYTSHFNSSPSFWARNLALDTEVFELVFDPVSPQYLFATEHLYTEHRLRKEFLKVYRPTSCDQLSIFHASECVFPDMNLFDYAVAYDRRLAFGDRIIRRPMPSIFAGFVREEMTAGCADPLAELRRKTAFCNFIYGNPAAHPRRDELFFELSAYKRVDALGNHLRNCPSEDSRAAENFEELCVQMKRPYKFSISCENAMYDGYVSEKLLTSWLARTVPIYWGDPTCGEEYNSKAFIDATHLTKDGLLAAVRRVDENDELWADIVSQPLLTPEQHARWQADERRYREFMNNLFLDPVRKRKRLQRGFWPDNVQRQFVLSRAKHFSRTKRILAALGRESKIGDWVFANYWRLRGVRPRKERSEVPHVI